MFEGPGEVSPITEPEDVSPPASVIHRPFQGPVSKTHSQVDAPEAKFDPTEPVERASAARSAMYTSEGPNDGEEINWVHSHNIASHPLLASDSTNIHSSSPPPTQDLASHIENPSSDSGAQARLPLIQATPIQAWSVASHYDPSPLSATPSSTAQRYMSSSYSTWNRPLPHSSSEASLPSYDRAPATHQASDDSRRQYPPEPQATDNPDMYRSPRWEGAPAREETTSLPVLESASSTQLTSSGASTTPSPSFSGNSKNKGKRKDKGKSKEQQPLQSKPKSSQPPDRITSSARTKRKPSSGESPREAGDESGEDGKPKRRGKLPQETTDMLREWLMEHKHHPYPSEEEKKDMCRTTGLHMTQLSNWFINARRRILPPGHQKGHGSSSAHGPQSRRTTSMTATGGSVPTSHVVIYQPRSNPASSQYSSYAERHHATPQHSPYLATAPRPSPSYSVPQAPVEQSRSHSYAHAPQGSSSYSVPQTPVEQSRPAPYVQQVPRPYIVSQPSVEQHHSSSYALQASGSYSVPQSPVEQSRPNSYAAYPEYQSAQTFYAPSPNMTSMSSTQVSYTQGGSMPVVQTDNETRAGPTGQGSFGSYSTPLLPNQGYSSPVPPSSSSGLSVPLVYQPQPQQPQYYSRDASESYRNPPSR